MRRVLRPIRLGVVGVCVLVVMGLVAAPSAAGAGAAPERPWMDSSLRPEARARLLLAQMTLEEKVGQMTQAERGAVTADPSLITTWRLGSLLSGGGSVPTPNTPEAWADMVDGFQAQALQTRLGIPLIYGVDSVHGHGNLVGATVFPHNIGLGATRDPRLVERVEHVTAEETRATGPQWVFAPCVCVA
ncbi:MAG TPA: glycoside hydrolase family 3 N-terminal domain-containing protein, partial [Actinomycetes bacterium]|nr:glycoside hydrolase family 3 N-terminal domain-containing protein [Actinomycetes bacterium]